MTARLLQHLSAAWVLCTAIAGVAHAGAGRRPVTLAIDPCVPVTAAEVRRLLAIEIRPSETKSGPKSPARSTSVQVGCGESGVTLRVGAGTTRLHRTLDLDAAAANARARLLALAIAELVVERDLQAAERAAAPRRKPEPEHAMYQRVLATSLAALLATLATAAAAPPRTPEGPPPPAAPPPRAPRPSAAPGLSAEALFGPVGDRLKGVTDSQIEVLKRLLAQTPAADPERAELGFRLGEHYAEQQRLSGMRARDLDQKIHELAGRDPRAADALRARRAAFEKDQAEARLLAVKQYLEVAERHPTFARTDELLHALAWLLVEAGKPDAALTYYKRLIKDFPTSPFVPDALVRFADHYFDAGALESALRFYDKVLELPRSRVQGYALYKKGWVQFNLRAFQAALASFILVIERKDQLALEREARRDAVRAFAQIGAPERAWPLFQRIGSERAPVMLEQLAEIYNDQGKFGDAIAIWHQRMALDRRSSRLCDWQGEVVKNTLQRSGGKADPGTLQELERWAALAGGAECKSGLVAALKEAAVMWHREAQKTGQRRSFELADAVYRLYLGKEPTDAAMAFFHGELLYATERTCDAAARYDVVVARGPSKWLSDAALGAVQAWQACLKLEDAPRVADTARGQAPPVPRAIPESWRRMLAAFDAYLTHVPDGAEGVAILYRKARALYEFDHIDAALPLFAQLVERHPAHPLAVYAADLLFDCWALKQKPKELEAAVGAYCPRPELQRDAGFQRRCRVIRAAILWQRAEELERAGRHREAADAYLALAEAFPDDPRLDEIYYNAAIALERARMIGPAVLTFQRLLQLRPESRLAKKSIFRIGRNFQDVADFERAAENYETFAIKWPGERDASAALWRASLFRRGLGQTDKALDDSRLFQRNYGGRAELADAAAGVAFADGQIFEASRDPARLERHLRGWLRDWGARGGVDRQVVAHVKLGELLWRASCPVPGVNGACVEVRRTSKPRDQAKKESCGAGLAITVHPRRPSVMKEALAELAEGLRLYRAGAAARVPGRDEAERASRIAEMAAHAAQARLIEGDLEYERFLELRVPGDLDFTRPQAKRIFRAWLGQKARQLENARRVYESVILMKQTHQAIAAAARVGQLFQAYAAQLGTTPIPKAPPPPAGLSAAKWTRLFQDAYCEAFDEQVIVLEDKAASALASCLTRSTELSWFNEWSALCEAELNQLAPQRYPYAAELRAQPGYAALSTDRTPVQPLPAGP